MLVVGREKSLNAREFKKMERRGVGESITDNSFKGFLYATEQKNGVGVGRSEIKKEEIIAHLYDEKEKVMQE